MERYCSFQHQREQHSQSERRGESSSHAAAAEAEAGTKKIYDKLRVACNFTPTKASGPWAGSKKKLGGWIGSEGTEGSSFFAGEGLEPLTSQVAGLLSPSSLLSAIKRIASPPNRHDLPKLDHQARQRTNVAKQNGKKLMY